MNKFPGPCAACGVRVAEEAGLLVGPPWRVYCADCGVPVADCSPASAPAAAVAAPSPPRVRLEPAPDVGRAQLRRCGFLSETAYRALVRACASNGAVWMPEPRIWSIATPALPALVRALREAGFAVEVAPELAAALQAEADAARRSAAAADARIVAVREELAARGKRLFTFQEEGVLFLAESEGALLADDPGTGKTITAAMAIPASAPVIAVVPVNVRGNWRRELESWRPSLQVRVLRGRNALERWPRPGEVFVLGYESLDALPGERGEKDGKPVPPPGPDAPGLPAGAPPPGTVLIFDEAHRLKGAATLRTKRARALAAAVRSSGGGHIWPLTGTPLKNRAEELYEVLEVAGLGATTFGSRSKLRQLALDDPEEYARRLSGVMLRRTKGQVLKDLPAKIHQEMTVELDDATRAELDVLLRDMIDRAAEVAAEKARKEARAEGENPEEAAEDARDYVRGSIEAAVEMVFSGEARIPFEMIARCKTILAAAKVDASLELVEDLEESGEPVVFASAHLAPAKTAAARDGWRLIAGETPDHERDEIVRLFQAGELRGVALTAAGGEGITLTRASRMVRNDRDWTPASNRQMADRLHRIGQTACVHVYDFVADHPLDERISALLARKEAEEDVYVAPAATARPDARRDRAAEIAGALELEGVTVGDSASDPAIDRRGPASAAEAWALEAIWKSPSGDFAVSLREQFLRLQGLTERQWQAGLQWAEERHSRGELAAEVGAPPVSAAARRTATGAEEEWARGALLHLAGLDGDHARERNGVGFNRLDGPLGHALARAIQAGGELTEREWSSAMRIARRYPGQVGRPAPAMALVEGGRNG